MSLSDVIYDECQLFRMMTGWQINGLSWLGLEHLCLNICIMITANKSSFFPFFFFSNWIPTDENVFLANGIQNIFYFFLMRSFVTYRDHGALGTKGS